jgi:hypothetical protein
VDGRAPYVEDRVGALVVAVLAGLVAAAACGVAWGLLTQTTNHEYGIAALVVGLIVGFAVAHTGARAQVVPVQAIAGLCALLGILLGKYLEVVFIGSTGLFSSLAWRVFTSSSSGLWGGLDLLWIAIAVLQAIRMPRRMRLRAMLAARSATAPAVFAEPAAPAEARPQDPA